MYAFRPIVKVIRVSHAKFHCNRIKTVQDIQDYASVIFAITSDDSPGIICLTTLAFMHDQSLYTSGTVDVIIWIDEIDHFGRHSRHCLPNDFIRHSGPWTLEVNV